MIYETFVMEHIRLRLIAVAIKRRIAQHLRMSGMIVRTPCVSHESVLYMMNEFPKAQKVQKSGYLLNQGVRWRSSHDDGVDDAVGGVGIDSEGAEVACESKIGEGVGEDMSGSAETTIVGELWPWGMCTTELIEEADRLFRV